MSLWNVLLVLVVNPDVPQARSFLFSEFIHLPTRFRTLDRSILHFFCFLALIQQFCFDRSILQFFCFLALIQQFCLLVSLFRLLLQHLPSNFCVWCDIKIAVSPFKYVDSSHPALSGSCASSAHTRSLSVVVVHSLLPPLLLARQLPCCHPSFFFRETSCLHI